MSSSKKAKIAFALALLLLCLSGIASGFAIIRLYSVESLVHHTYDVQVAVGDVEAALTEVGRDRLAYLDEADPQTLKSFNDAVNDVSAALTRLRQLTADNPEQQLLCDRLESNAHLRVASSQSSVEAKLQGQSSSEKQLDFTFHVAKAAFDTAAITEKMRQNEDQLLRQRSRLSQLLFAAIPGILAVSFMLSAGMFWLHYRLLNRELNERKGAETQLRHLSLQLMRVQDEEHRRFGRELHDGLGQTLAGAKMMIDALGSVNPETPEIAELVTLLGEAVAQTRTISYLFHPPFLDEIGFASAAKWLIEGYAQRTGMAVSVNIPKLAQRLPQSLELTLYRVLQEALNNIHRHSKSDKVEVTVQTDAKCATLRVRDYGKGIPGETLAAVRNNAAHTGVGLTGMKERVREQGGELEIWSEGTGTEIVVKIPIHAHLEVAHSTSTPPVLNTL